MKAVPTAKHASTMAKLQNVHGQNARLKMPAKTPPMIAPAGAVAPNIANTLYNGYISPRLSRFSFILQAQLTCLCEDLEHMLSLGWQDCWAA